MRRFPFQRKRTETVPATAALRVLEARTLEEVRLYFQSGPAPERCLSDGARFLTARCYVCDRVARLLIDRHSKPINWRETLACPHCGLVNRWRGALHLLEILGAPTAKSDIFTTEAVSPLFRQLRRRYPRALGSEYRHGARPGSTIRLRLRKALMQDVTGLTFNEASFDFVLSLDVLEHVPDYRRALREFHRVLRPGGMLLLSVPFTARDEHEIRASVAANGEIVHHLPPLYHRDPTSRQGALCYRSFGMVLLDDLRHAGFADARAACYASADWGYLGEDVVFVARKAPCQRSSP